MLRVLQRSFWGSYRSIRVVPGSETSEINEGLSELRFEGFVSYDDNEKGDKG